MASYNVVFAIDVDYCCDHRGASEFHVGVRRWLLKTLLSLGVKYGLEKVRWGYRFFHSSPVTSGSLVTRGTDFRELQEKPFSEFEDELLVKLSGDGERRATRSASCVHNALREILLDFQWDRPDITSPTKLTLRPRASNRGASGVSLTDDELACHGRNVLFVVSPCPRSERELCEFVRCEDGASRRELLELALPRRLADVLHQRRVALYWADCSSYELDNGVEDYMGLEIIKDVLQLVAGKVVPVLTPCCGPDGKNPQVSTAEDGTLHEFPVGSSTGYIFSSEKTYQQIFPPVAGRLYWGPDADRQACSVSFEPVSCRQRLLCAPVEVMLRTVLQDMDTFCLGQSVSECWVLLCPNKPEDGQAAFQCLLKELYVQASGMLAEVREGDRIHTAVLSVLSPQTALLTVLQPPATKDDAVLDTSLISSEVSDDSVDLPDVVSSVLNVMYDIMKDEDCSEQIDPEWANREVQQRTCLSAELTEGWFPLSDQSGISCHLMESMRLLHAAPEEEEQREADAQLELTNSLAELYQSSRAGPSTGLKGKKKGAQRTPVRQKMKTMSRSLQMLNVARFNVKAQKNQTETDSSNSAKGTERRGKRCSGERAKAGPVSFKSEEELLSHLKLKYQQSVEDRSISLNSQVQDLLSVVKTFNTRNNNEEASVWDLIKKNLLKSTQSIRKLYASSPDAESKIRDCQLQVSLRLELCRQSSSNQDPDYVEQLVEEMAGMLRIISLTNDPVYLSKFMQEEILPLYLNNIPRVLGDIYNSLGTQLPEALVAVLPSDFFSDDSMARDSVSVSPSPLTATQSMGSVAGDRLEELRNRSAKKRRSNMLTRHKSMTEASQTLRQIEMPRKTTRQTKPTVSVPSEKLGVESQPPQKQAVQEVTKVRRNLFNHGTVSPSKKAKMPRSQSVSAVEGIKKRKRSHVEDERRTLLTKKVSETPLHKQVSNRLLYRQRHGRRSDETDMTIVEESPIKPAADLRRSPRIKNLTRRHSSVFYSSSQPRSRNLDRALSFSQLPSSEGKGSINVRAVKSPMRLLFGAAQSPGRLNSRRSEAGSTDAVFENATTPPRKSPYKQYGSRTPKTPKAQCSSLLKSPGRAVGENGMILRGSPFRSPAAKSLVLETPKKSPLKGILRTPVKTFMECGTPTKSCLKSPGMKTPRKSVTWSPSPRKRLPEKTFKVPESPQSSNRYSPKLLTPSKFHTSQNDVFKTPEKLPPRKCTASPELAQRPTKVVGNVAREEPELGRRSERKRKKLSLPAKDDQHNTDALSVDLISPPTPENTTPKKSIGATHRMRSRSPRTPPTPENTTPKKSLGATHRMRSRSPRTAPTPENTTPKKSLGATHRMRSRSPRTPPTPENTTPKKSLGATHRMRSRSPRTPPTPENTTPKKSLGATHRMRSRSPRTPPTPENTTPKKSLGATHRMRSRSPRTPYKCASLPISKAKASLPNISDETDCNQLLHMESRTKEADDGQNESTQEITEEGSSSDSQQLDSSRFSGTTTEESIDITEASILKTELTSGIKMSFSFSRKSSKRLEGFEFTAKQALSSGGTQVHSYGFRQTPDRQQRKAAARLQCSPVLPMFSTPHTSGTSMSEKEPALTNPLTYEVELEMQSSGLPKLKFKRTDSFSSNEVPDIAIKSLAPHVINARASRIDSPVSHCSKHRESGCISPSYCTNGTPGKGGVQTYICHSVTPTRLPTNSPSPLGPGEHMPWTPSPQSRTWSTAENLNSWPRKKRARTDMLGTKESSVKGEAETLEDPELDGVFRLQGVEELKESRSSSACKYRLSKRSRLCSTQEVDCSESMIQQYDQRDAVKCEELTLKAGKGTLGSVGTPPNSKVKKPVSVSGILALTQSPLLYKGKKATNTKEIAQPVESSRSSQQCGDKGEFTVDVSPLNPSRKRQACGRTYSRKRLLDS